MRVRRGMNRPTRRVGLFSVLTLVALASGCSGDGVSCSVDADCFQGETCEQGLCETGSSSNADPNSSSGGTNASGATNANGATNSSTADQFAGAACVVETIANQCDEDEHEPNDGLEQSTGRFEDIVVWESDSWCTADGLQMPTRTFSAALCPGDGADAFRFVLANNGPACIESDFTTFRITFDFDTACPEQLLEVQPYYSGLGSTRDDLCADDDAVICRTENDGQTRIIEWRWELTQIFDPHVQVVPARDDLEVDYEVTVEVLPQ